MALISRSGPGFLPLVDQGALGLSFYRWPVDSPSHVPCSLLELMGTLEAKSVLDHSSATIPLVNPSWVRTQTSGEQRPPHPKSFSTYCPQNGTRYREDLRTGPPHLQGRWTGGCGLRLRGRLRLSQEPLPK
uniref:Uncharacterized protein n=1 Tax=Molossus molossus TaxID=27622 RepID=A0A7J8BHX6_MOLMO|nr:hypothetical protein HJG59_010461 [Molossus molossus]